MLIIPCKRVTPFTGVWIEMRIRCCQVTTCTRHTLHGCVDRNSLGFAVRTDRIQSHPSRVCGSKSCKCYQAMQQMGSHPSRVCGSKLSLLCASRLASTVTPFTGVWIEIIYSDVSFDRSTCHTLHGCVDRNRLSARAALDIKSHTLHGCVDRNSGAAALTVILTSHTLHGCVDRN